MSGPERNAVRVDVAVVGGGPAGTTVAACLGRAGVSVLLCDGAVFPRHKICGEYLSPAVAESLERLGVWGEVMRLGPRRQVGMAVISPGGTEVLGRYGAPSTHGFSLRRIDLDRLLLENARRSGAEVMEGWKMVDLARGEDRLVTLTLRSSRPGGALGRGAAGGAGLSVRARAIVGADGRNSLVARRLGLRRADRHRRFAVMGHFRGVRAPDDHGEMIITPYGYCGINPLPGGLANVCIVLDPRRHPGPLPGRDRLAPFLRATIDSHPPTRRSMADAVLADGPWATGPIACRASRSIADGALLVGDAAGFFDPFTGEGIAMALRGGEMAAETLLDGLARGDMSERRLAPYADRRRAAFAARLRLDRLLQALLARPRLADWVAGKLRRDQRLADGLARVTGDTAEAGTLLRPGFVARLLLA